MNIGILGAGNMGVSLARLFAAAGHEVTLSNSRGPQSLTTVLEALGAAATAATPDELSRNCDVVVLATRWNQAPQALGSLAPRPQSIIIDTTNPRFGPGPQDIYDIGDRSSSEVIADMVPWARVVKAFNHAPITSLQGLALEAADARKALFVAGDDDCAKQVVESLIRDIGGEPIDTGNLSRGGALQDTGRPLAGHGRLLTVAEARALLISLSVEEHV